MDIIRSAYYIHGLELMKLIFAVLAVSLTMGLTRRYKTEGFLIYLKLLNLSPQSQCSSLTPFMKSLAFLL